MVSLVAVVPANYQSSSTHCKFVITKQGSCLRPHKVTVFRQTVGECSDGCPDCSVVHILFHMLIEWGHELLLIFVWELAPDLLPELIDVGQVIEILAYRRTLPDRKAFCDLSSKLERDRVLQATQPVGPMSAIDPTLYIAGLHGCLKSVRVRNHNDPAEWQSTDIPLHIMACLVECDLLDL